VTHGDSEDEVLRNNEDEGATEKEGDNAAMDDGDTESEDIQYTADEVATWERFRNVLKESCVKQVCFIVLWFAVMIHTDKFAMQTTTVTQKCLNTHDVHLCFREGVRVIDNKEIAGYYCVFCLNGNPPQGAMGWQTGNVTAQR